MTVGAAPISGGAGADIRGEPDFETLEATVRRIDSEGPGAVRWQDVARDGLSITETRSKDLLVGVWTAFALTRLEGVTGLAVGLGVLEGMIDQHWDGLQPPVKRERARVGAMEWLVGRLSVTVAEWQVDPADYPAILAAYGSLDAIDRMLSDKLTKEQASLGELVRAIRPKADIARRAKAEAEARAAAATEPPPPEPTAAPVATPQPQAAPQPAPAAPAPIAAPSASVTPPAAAPSTVGADIERSLSQLTDAIRAHALSLRQSDLTDPRGYILTRIGAWLAIRRPPPSQSGRTALPPPDAARLSSVDTLQKASRHADAVQAAEGIVAASPFCIDANLWVARALMGLGPSHRDAQLAVATATAGLLLRVPELRDLAFSDGRPFVSDAINGWLADAGVLGGSGGASPDATDAVDMALAEARKLAQDGKPRDGVAHLTAALAAAGGGRTRLRVQLAQAQFLVEQDMHVAAWSLLDHLDGEIARRSVEDWEPELAARTAELRLKIGALPQLAKYVPDDRRRLALEEARTRLARCDISAAVRLLV